MIKMFRFNNITLAIYAVALFLVILPEARAKKVSIDPAITQTFYKKPGGSHGLTSSGDEGYIGFDDKYPNSNEKTHRVAIWYTGFQDSFTSAADATGAIDRVFFTWTSNNDTDFNGGKLYDLPAWNSSDDYDRMDSYDWWNFMSNQNKYDYLSGSQSDQNLLSTGVDPVGGRTSFNLKEGCLLVSQYQFGRGAHSGDDLVLAVRESPESTDTTLYDDDSSVIAFWPGKLEVYFAPKPTLSNPANGTDVQSGDSVTLSWSSSDTDCENINYRLQLSLKSDFDNDPDFEEEIVDGKTYTFTVGPNHENERWYWRVQARNKQVDDTGDHSGGAWNSNYGACSSFSSYQYFDIVEPEPVSPPTGVSATDGTSTSDVAVSWESVSGASHYRVYRSTSSSGSKASRGDWQSSRTYNDTSATPGTTYYYWVKAAASSSGDRASDYSSSNSGWRKLSVPGSVSATDGTWTATVAVSWDSVSGANYYHVYRSTSSSGTKKPKGDWQSDELYSDTSASPSATYYYWVAAATDSSGSRSSGYSSSDTGWRKLSPPTGVSATDGTSTSNVAVSWDTVGGASHYHVYRSTSSGGDKESLGDWQSSRTYDDTPATPGTTYYYWIKAATNSSGGRESGFSSSNTGWQKLSAPTGVSATDGTSTGNVAVSWGSVSGASYYQVYRSTSSGGGKSPRTGWQSDQSYNDTSVTPGVTYYYWVKAATNSSGDRASDYSSSDTGHAAKAISTNTTSVSVPENGTGTFGVKLSVQPSSDVDVSVSRLSGDTHISVQTGSTLTFTSKDYDTYQYVTLDAAEDADAIDGTATIRCTATNWTSKSVTATENDNDREFDTNLDSVTVPEKGTATFQVRLKAKPSVTVAVTVSHVGGDSHITVQSGENPTFDSTNWNSYRTVTLAAAEDADAIDGTATIRCTATNWTSKDVTATENDNDREFDTNLDSVTVPEKGTATFQVRLKAKPSETVAVTVSHVSGDSHITVQSGANPTFNSTTWNTYRTVTLAAAADTDAVNGTATIRCSAADWTNKDVTATEDDAQGTLTITAPSSGVKWEQGTACNIAWTSSGNPGSEVKLEYSVNNGASWPQIIGSTDNDGTHPWTVPDTASLQCLVRITSTSKPYITDTSDATFTIIGSAHHLTFDSQPTDTIATEGTTPVISPSPTVRICDVLGTTVVSSSAQVTVALTGGGGSSATLLGTTARPASSGVATFGDLRITRAGTNFQLHATSSGLAGVDSGTFDVTAEPALSVAKADSADPVDPNTQVTYTVSYGNAGLAAASNVVIVETLPANLSFVSATGGGVYNAGTGTVTWTLGTIPAQTTGQTVTFTAKVNGNLAEGGTITNTSLTIDCDETDPVTATAETTTVNDTKAPEVSGQVPAVNATLVPREPLIQLNVTDGGSGVKYDGGTVTIAIEGDVIYDGNNETSPGEYDTRTVAQSVKGLCRRTGTAADYQFSFTPSTTFDFEQQVDVVVDAVDEAGNATSVSYHFTTETRSFGANAKVNSDSGTVDQDNPATAVDSSGNTWVVWDQATAAGDTDIYIGKLTADGSSFDASNAVFSGANTESHPVIAVDGSDTVYAAWQGTDPNGLWDVYVSTSADGITWSAPVIVNVGDVHRKSSQQYPSIAIDRLSPNTVYIAYEDNRAGNKDIWLATSTNGTSWTETQVSAHASDQTQPCMTVDLNDNSAQVFWTDARNGGLDVYSALSTGTWANVAYVTEAGNQSGPAGVASGTSHLLWVGDVGSNSQLFYDDNQAVPLTGASIVDTSNTTVSDPTMALRVTGTNTKLFAAWTDERNVSGNADTDVYYAENGSPFGTNILINDDTGTRAQGKPAIGVDGDGNPYIVWVDERNGNKDIYYTVAMDSNSLPTREVTDANGTTIEVTTRDNLSVEIPTGALPEGAAAEDIKISEIGNPPKMPSLNSIGLPYEFKPSGLVFTEPVTIRIPLTEPSSHNQFTVYRYDPTDLASLNYPWTTEGILNPATKVTTATGTCLEVQVRHFSIYGGSGSTYIPHSGGGGGGCALSPYGGGSSPLEFFLPFIVCCVFGLGLRGLDRRRVRKG